MFFYETHMHTAETSRCGCSSASDMIIAYKNKGFCGVVVTDHFMNGYSYAAFPEKWDDKVNVFLKGYNAAKAEGDKVGVTVFLGWEFTYLGNGEDYLTYGLGEEFLFRNSNCSQWDIDRYANVVHSAGGLLIRAHPYRVADYIKNPCIVRPNIADVIEVFNGGNANRAFDDQALQYAVSNNLPMSAGSDAHHVDNTAIGYIGFDSKIDSYNDLCSALLEQKAHLIRNPRTEHPCE